MSPYWTKERIITSIQLWHKQHGHPPTWRDWSTRKGLPSDYPVSMTVSHVFGRWTEAIEAAGFTTVPQQVLVQEQRKRPATAAERRAARIEALRRAIEKEESVE